MTAGWAVLMLLVLVVLFEQWRHFDGEYRCRYCGVLLGHDSHCPYNNQDVA